MALALIAFAAATSLALAGYTIESWTISGGGGTGSGGNYTLTGTIGQPAAGAAAGGSYSLYGGFWSATIIQTTNAPRLSLTNAAGQITVSWPKPAEGWVLQTTTAFVPPPGATTWTAIPGPYAGDATHFRVTQAIAPGNKFFRLHKP
jgi:hypothetical protein